MKNLKTKFSYAIYFVLCFVVLSSCKAQPDELVMIKPYIITGKYQFEILDHKMYCKYLYQDATGKHSYTYDVATLYNVGDTIK